MTNDLSTLNGALLEMKDQLIYELGQKGVTASYSSSDGLLGLIGKISEIQTGGGSCYKVTFDNASYTTTGSVTVSVTVLKNYSACVGETVTFTSSTSTTTTATTDSNGVATATISFSGSTTLTASIGGATDTATVTVQQGYLFYDECTSADGLSNYGQVVPVTSTTTTSYLEYNSTNNAYYVHANGDWGVIPITALNGADNFKITGEFKTRSSGNTYQGGFMFRAQNSTSNITFRMYGSYCNSVINDSSQQNIGDVSASSNWYKFEITKEGLDFTVKVTNVATGTVIGTQSRTVSFDTYYAGFMTVAGTSYGSYVRNVKAEYI